MDNVYIVYLVDIKKLSPEDMQKNFECYKIKYNKPDFSFERFVELMNDWGNYPYHITADPQGYYATYEDAKRNVQSNVCDINEAGAFPYVVIASMPLDCIYPTATEKRSFNLFNYDVKQDKYYEINWDEDQFQRLLKFAKCGGM